MKEDELINEFLHSLDGGDFRPLPPKGTFTPTLVVGLGGTGCRVVRRLKGYLGSHSKVRLLGVDSDKSENDKFEMPPLDDSELCLLDVKRAITWLDRFNAGDSDYQWLSDLLEENGPETSIQSEIRQKIQAGAGCGQRRRAGRLMFAANVTGGANVRGRLTKIYEELRGLRSELGTIHRGFKMDDCTRIFVVSSFAGGTGAGILMEMLGLLRTIFEEPVDQITLVGLLPGMALDKKLHDARSEKGFTRGNSIGVLRELNALQRPGASRVFRFGPMDTHEWDSSKESLATSVFLLEGDSGVKGGAPVDEWDEMTNASGFFLYNFLENRVGASELSGQVNYSPETNYEGEHGAVYRSFGISALRVPVLEIAKVGIYTAASNYLSGVMKPAKGGVSQAKKEMGQTLGALSLNGGASFRDLFDKIQVPEADALQTESQWKKLRFASDDELIGTIRSVLSDLEGSLPSYDSSCEEVVNESLEKFRQVFESRCLDLIAGNHAVVREYFSRLIATLQEWNADLYAKLDTVGKQIREGEQSLRYLEDRIHKLDFFLDWGKRKQYRSEVVVHISNLLDQYFLGKATPLSSRVIDLVRALETRCLGVLDELRGQRFVFQSYAEQLSKAVTKGLFVRSAMDGKQMAEWIEGYEQEIREVPAAQLTAKGVLKALFLPTFQSMVKALSARDLVAEATGEGKKHLKFHLRGIDEAAKPLIALKSEAPDIEDLTPQKYVLGVSAVTQQKALSDHFPKFGENETRFHMLDSDTGTICCLTTVVGFKISDLKRFDEFYGHYAKNPWIYHTDVDHRDLPSLDPRMDKEDHKYRLFGLGLFLEAVHQRGSNYYVNLVGMDRGSDQPSYQWVVFSKERSRFAVVAHENGLVAEPPKSQLRPTAEHRLDNSLEGALEALSDSEFAGFVGVIDDLWEDFVNRIGRREAGSLLQQFAEEILDPMIGRSKTQSDRRDALKRVYQAVRELADAVE